MENEVMAQPQGIKSFIEIGLSEMENEEEKPKSKKLIAKDPYSIEVANDQDVVIKRKTKVSEKILAVIMSQGIFYIKDMKNETISRNIDGNDIKAFMKDVSPNGDAHQVLFNLSWVKEAKAYGISTVKDINAFCHLLSDIIKNPHKIAMCQCGINVRSNYFEMFFKEIYENMNTEQNIKVACEIIKKAEHLLRESANKPYCVLNLCNNAFAIFLVYGIDIMRAFFTAIENGRVNYNVTECDDLQSIISTLKELENKGEISYESKERGRGGKAFAVLMKLYNLEPNRFFAYLFNEIYSQGYKEIDFYVLNTYVDTLSLQMKCFGYLRQKYPKYLETEHRIMILKYSFVKELYDAKVFKIRSEENSYLKYSKGKYEIVIPKSPDQVVDEGMNNHNCVASYVSSIISGNTFVCFMRYKESPEQSLVTVEIRDGSLVQAEGFSRRRPNVQEREFLEMFCKEKGLSFRI